MSVERSRINWEWLAAATRGAAKSRGMSMRQIAKEIGESPSTVHRIAQGTSPCDAEAYAAVCAWLGLSLDTFHMRVPS